MSKVARVCVAVTAHAVDRLFDFAVPDELVPQARIGARVRVRFAHRLVNGYIIELADHSQFDGELTSLKAVLGPPVLDEVTIELAQTVAARYAGSLAAVLRDAVPARHAAAERGLPVALPVPARVTGQPTAERAWQRLDRGEELLARVAQPSPPIRAHVVASVVDALPELAADLAASAGRALVVVPDEREIERFAAVFEQRFERDLARLVADDGPRRRYRDYLEVSTGHRAIPLGTRHSVLAAMPELNVIIVVDDNDDSLTEVRSPGWQVREVAALRSTQTECHFVMLSHSRSVAAARMVETGWAHSVVPTRAARQLGAMVASAHGVTIDDPDNDLRIPPAAFRAIRNALPAGPVLVQVARVGWSAGLACEACRQIQHCPQCDGPLTSDATGIYRCRWAGHTFDSLTCAHCGSTQFRALAVGSGRTREELSRAFPGVEVLESSSQAGVLTAVDDTSRIVVATIGSEPTAVGGYAATVLLDANRLLGRAHLRAEEDTLTHWFTALALTRPRSDGGEVVVTAAADQRAVQTLVRADPASWAQRELAERTEAGLPPATRLAVMTGEATAIDSLVHYLRQQPTWSDQWRVLPPMPVGQSHRVLMFAPLTDALEFAQTLVDVQRERSRWDGEVKIRIDDPDAL